ncbi:MAG: hypothetical protein M1274_03960 [Actinobacteria bacterium]|nr:hypothetical protein [Actinomycetota bacterium]
MDLYHQTRTPEARERLAAYARKVASTLTRAGHEPPEQIEYGFTTEWQRKFPFGKEAVDVPFRRSKGHAWEVFSVTRLYLVKQMAMRLDSSRRRNEHAGLMHEDYSIVIWLRRNGEIEVLERAEICRSYITPERVDVYYKVPEYSGDLWSLPDYVNTKYENKKQAKQAGYWVWVELRQPRLRYDKFGIGLSMALRQLATSHGVDLSQNRAQRRDL